MAQSIKDPCPNKNFQAALDGGQCRHSGRPKLVGLPASWRASRHLQIMFARRATEYGNGVIVKSALCALLIFHTLQVSNDHQWYSSHSNLFGNIAVSSWPFFQSCYKKWTKPAGLIGQTKNQPLIRSDFQN